MAHPRSPGHLCVDQTSARPAGKGGHISCSPSWPADRASAPRAVDIKARGKDMASRKLEVSEGEQEKSISDGIRPETPQTKCLAGTLSQVSSKHWHMHTHMHTPTNVPVGGRWRTADGGPQAGGQQMGDPELGAADRRPQAGGQRTGDPELGTADRDPELGAADRDPRAEAPVDVTFRGLNQHRINPPLCSLCLSNNP